MKTETIRGGGGPPITFKKGGLHETTGTPAGEKIPQAKINAALAGKYGPEGKKQAMFYMNVLKKGRRTALAKAAAGGK